MKIEAVEAAAKALVDVLPDEVTATIRAVKILVVEDTPAGWSTWDKAAFEGHPGTDDDEADLTGEDGELPRGTITLVARRFKDAREVHRIVLHEIGHALGFDENEVSLMGLSERSVLDGIADSTTDLE